MKSRDVKTSSTNERKPSDKKGGIFKYMAPLELDKIREHEEKMAAALRRRHEMEIYVPEYEPPLKRRKKSITRSKKNEKPKKSEVKNEPVKRKYLRYGPESLKIGGGGKNKFANVKTYWPAPPPQPVPQQTKPLAENTVVVNKPPVKATKSPATRSLYPIFNNIVKSKPITKTKPSPPQQQTPSSTKRRVLEELSPSLAMQKAATLIKTPGGGAGSKQLIIDAGQKNFGAIQCKLCSMVYSCNDPGDVGQHAMHHQQFIDALRFPGWKSERLVMSLMDGRIIKVLASDPRYALRKVDQIRAIVDLDLGFTKPLQEERKPQIVYYIYVSDENHVTSFVVAEPLTQAYRLLPTDTSDVMTCSKLPEPAVCGVSRVWTDPNHRRKGYASKLIDALRSTFLVGIHVERDEVAFSDPTPDGHKFAARYSGTDQFLTYHQT